MRPGECRIVRRFFVNEGVLFAIGFAKGENCRIPSMCEFPFIANYNLIWDKFTFSLFTFTTSSARIYPREPKRHKRWRGSKEIFQKGKEQIMVPKKLLIADDNSELRSILATALNGMPQLDVVGAAANGVEALELYEKFTPDIVLTDIIMPRLDGFGVLEYLAKRPKMPAVVVLSALNQEQFVLRAMELGAVYYVAKPFEMESLKNRILDVALRSEDSAIQKPARAPGNVLIANEKRRSIDEKISTVFITIGIPAHIKGFHFLREAIKMTVDNPDVINRITKELYPSIGRKFNTSASKVERAIRHAIEVAWTRGKIENINQIFGYNVYSHNDKPTNGEFIALIADRLLLEQSA